MSAPSAPVIVPRPLVQITSATFYWQPPASDGGSAVTGYVLECTASSISLSLAANVLSYTVSGLTSGTDYTFTIYATNAVGNSPLAEFRTIQPGLVPYGPTTASLSTLSPYTGIITWDNNSTITGEGATKWYRIRAEPSSMSISSFSLTAYAYKREAIVTNLTANEHYRFLVQAVNDTGYCEPHAISSYVYFPTFDPSSITGLALWLDAADASSVTLSGSDVTAWADKSGAGNNSTGVLGSVTYSTNSQNGKNTFLFNSGMISGGFSPQYTGAEMTYMFVGSLSGTNSEFATIMSIGLTNTADYTNQECMNVLGRSQNASSLVSYRNLPPYTATTISPGAYNVYVLIAVVVNGTTQTVYLNGTQVDQVTYGYTPNFNLQGWAIGNSARDGSLNTQYTAFSGRYAESAMYEAALNTSDRQTMEGYLAWKWGLQDNLPAAHPYKNIAPIG
jgi:hypothetical protein